jgi:hypothetical protein
MCPFATTTTQQQPPKCLFQLTILHKQPISANLGTGNEPYDYCWERPPIYIIEIVSALLADLRALGAETAADRPSSNEDLDDVLTSSLFLLSLPYYLADLVGRQETTDPGQRLGRARFQLSLLSHAFLGPLRQLRVLAPEDAAALDARLLDGARGEDGDGAAAGRGGTGHALTSGFASSAGGAAAAAAAAAVGQPAGVRVGAPGVASPSRVVSNGVGGTNVFLGGASRGRAVTREEKIARARREKETERLVAEARRRRQLRSGGGGGGGGLSGNLNDAAAAGGGSVFDRHSSAADNNNNNNNNDDDDAAAATVGSTSTRLGRRTRNEGDGGEDCEDEDRELRLLLLRLQGSRAMDTSASLQDEISMLEMMEAARKQNPSIDDDMRAERRREQEEFAAKVEAMARGGGSIAGSQVTATAAKRQEMIDGVFRPFHRLPTMTLDEFAETEIAEARERQAREKEAEAAKAAIDSEDEEEVDRRTYKARSWDAFKDDNPKGWGNTKR